MPCARRPAARRALLLSTVVLVLVAGLAGAPLAGRPEAAPGAGQDAGGPRTPWGDPDLQGMWLSSGLVTVPFERPAELGTRAVLTEAELAARNAAAAARPRPRLVPSLGFGERRPAPPLASLIVDPADGRLPPMTADGARRAEAWRTRAAADYAHAGPEDLRPYDRCISRGVLGSSFPNIYSSAIWILQAPGLVILHHEMIHETRVIPLDGRPHIAPGIRQWIGRLARAAGKGRRSWWIPRTPTGGRAPTPRNGNGNPTSTALHLVERLRLGESRHASTTRCAWTTRARGRGPWTVAFPLERDPRLPAVRVRLHTRRTTRWRTS